MTRMTQTNFDPCAIWPARVPDKTVQAKPIEPGTMGAAGGSYNPKTKTATLPTADNYYARTIRLHESLHAIYTKRKGPYSNLEQGLEDARLHLLHAKTSGRVRRDELATALRDLRSVPANQDLAAILALRASAILAANVENYGEKYQKQLLRMADAVDKTYHAAIGPALDSLRADDWDKAVESLKPFFKEAKPEEQTFPSSAKLGFEKGGDKTGQKFADVSFGKLEGKLTSEAADMISPAMAKEISGKGTKMPTLNIHQIFANANVRTFFGETEKHCLTGSKIDAKRLALCVGPAMPRLFTKTIKRNGGTVVIDASGSMDLTDDMLLELLLAAPMATIGFYNAFTDSVWTGNLWIFAHKGRRANDLSAVNREVLEGPTAGHGWITTFGSGNVVDFQVIQWLLAQPAPRYILTDGSFVGPSCTSNLAARELLANAISRKKLTQIGSFKKMKEVLAGKGIELTKGGK